LVEQIEDNEMGRACGMCGGENQSFSGTTEGKIPLETPDRTAWTAVMLLGKGGATWQAAVSMGVSLQDSTNCEEVLIS
jgi:hypothetical protein